MATVLGLLSLLGSAEGVLLAVALATDVAAAVDDGCTEQEAYCVLARCHSVHDGHVRWKQEGKGKGWVVQRPFPFFSPPVLYISEPPFFSIHIWRLGGLVVCVFRYRQCKWVVITSKIFLALGFSSHHITVHSFFQLVLAASAAVFVRTVISSLPFLLHYTEGISCCPAAPYLPIYLHTPTHLLQCAVLLSRTLANATSPYCTLRYLPPSIPPRQKL